MTMDPRFTVHNETVQRLPSSQPNPRKKIGHATKAKPRVPLDGAYFGIKARAPIIVKKRKHYRRRG